MGVQNRQFQHWRTRRCNLRCVNNQNHSVNCWLNHHHHHHHHNCHFTRGYFLSGSWWHSFSPLLLVSSTHPMWTNYLTAFFPRNLPYSFASCAIRFQITRSFPRLIILFPQLKTHPSQSIPFYHLHLCSSQIQPFHVFICVLAIGQLHVGYGSFVRWYVRRRIIFWFRQDFYFYYF